MKSVVVLAGMAANVTLLYRFASPAPALDFSKMTYLNVFTLRACPASSWHMRPFFKDCAMLNFAFSSAKRL
jgi:hypothetical protein